MPRELTPDEMFEAMQELTDFPFDVTLQRRRRENCVGSPGNKLWYVHLKGVEIKERHVLKGVGGDGGTPIAAIEDTWRHLTELQADEYLVVNAVNDAERRACRWNGSRWAPVKEETPCH
jgi:hypothetical protein